MTVANQLEERGIEKGALIGRIQEYQEFLNQQVVTREEFLLNSDEILEQL